MIGMTTLLGYMLVMFGVGVIGTLVLLLWLFGPAARTIGIAHMFNDPIVQIPTEDRRWNFRRIKNVDEKGRYHFETEEGKHRVWKPDPDDVFIEGGKAPLVTALKNLVVSANPFKAFAAEADEKTDKENPEIEWYSRVEWENDKASPLVSVNWNSIRKKIKEVMSPSHYGSMWSASMDSTRNFEPPEGDSGLNVGGMTWIVVIMGVVATIVGIFIAFQMGWI